MVDFSLVVIPHTCMYLRDHDK